MSIEEDLERLAEQERRLRFDSFDVGTAWRLGLLLRERAAEAEMPLAIDVELAGMPVFLTVLAGATPDNLDWIRRKRNVALFFHRPSYAVGLALRQSGQTLRERHGLDARDYAAHGGSFPILLKKTGCIGAVTVSGLPQREDHAMVAGALATLLRIDPAGLALPEHAA